MSSESEGRPRDPERTEKSAEPEADRKLSYDSESRVAPTVHGARLPEAIGDYRILGRLGEGGMGVVYEAEQPHPKRRVALKVIRGGAFVDDLEVRLFEREVETLARLKHPNIGGIYDAGHTGEGQHFFAMELVEGETLEEYLTRRPEAAERREIEHRLDLFRQICDAVHYAHQRGVIHRDLKPSNIIVTGIETDQAGSGEPQAKILDFGLARLTDREAAGATVLSEAGSIKGTLPYMSPEQARGEIDEIDLRTDVYSLGVILYEMLVGALPYDTQKSSLISSLKVICEERPRPLRVAWTSLRRVDPDLETIVGKALEKEADERYDSAAALSADISRFLASQPIQARPPSTAYQLKKLVARNKLPTAFAATVLMLLLGFGIWMSVLFARATRAEAKASQEAETATQVSDFMVRLFEVSDPSEAQGNTITAREILDRGADKIERELSNQPVIEARLLHAVGKVYWGLGLLDASKALLEKSLDRRERHLGADDPEVAATLAELASVQLFLGEWQEARDRLLRARQIHAAAAGAESLEVAEIGKRLGDLYLEHRRWPEAEAEFRGAAAIQERFRPDADLALADSLESLARLLSESGRVAEAEPLVDRTIAVREALLGPDHPEMLAALRRLATVYHDRGDYERAADLAEELVVRRRKVLGPEHFDTLEAAEFLSHLDTHRGRLAEAEAAYAELLPIAERLLGRGPRYAQFLFGLTRIRGNQGRFRDAIEVLKEIQEIFEAAVENGEAGEIPWFALGLRAHFHLKLNEPDIAASLLDRVDEEALSPEQRIWQLVYVARVHMHRSNYDTAQATFERALSLEKDGHGDHNTSVSIQYYLGILQYKQGRLEKASETLEHALAAVDQPTRVDAQMVASVSHHLGLVRRDQGRIDEAEELLRRALSVRRTLAQRNHPETEETLTALSELLRGQGRNKEAAELEREAAEDSEVLS